MVNQFIAPMVIAAKISKYFSRFENAGAVSPGNAKTLQSLGLHGGFLFNRLVRNKVFIETSPGKYYVSRENFDKFRAVRKRRALLIIAGVLGILGILLTIYFIL